MKQTKTSKLESCWEPDCPYSDKCSDKGFKCNNCKHNKKKSYFEREIPYYPYKYIEPYVLPNDYPLPPVRYTVTVNGKKVDLK